MSGYGPRGFEQRNTFRLRNPDDFQQGISYPLRRADRAARDDHRPTADRWPTTEDRWPGGNDRWAAAENPRFAAAPWSPEDGWSANHWPPADEQWAEDRPSDEAPGDPTPTDQWTWSNDRWQSPSEPWAAPATQVPDDRPRPSRRAGRSDTSRAPRTGVDRRGGDHNSVSRTDHGRERHIGAERATLDSAEPRKRRGGRHRMPAPPTALKGRAAIVAVAAGAIVAAGQNLETGSAKAPAQSVAPMALGQPQAVDPVAVSSEPHNNDPGLLAEGPATLGQFADMLQNGSKVADEIAADVQAKLRPLFVKFTSGTFTSGYGMRWGTLHPGVDVAAPIGTPIVAVEDGTVISAGPASGFGMWVRVLGDDGTVTVYGHINTALVSVGQHVTAGDEIATVGNRGETTGPHCHFEVWLNGTDRIDPLPWLATRGIGLGPERD
ncbi:M23 family metallopeptidase [Nocardia brasiliensis]|uniref:M23 family metallopeptidase n=1 Tax=Nocardia brasiliensis TaxID=37326 RepID=UPI001E2CA4D4|nr:M23 family metallopeptidase [Nocardia brasiliensis]